MMATSGNSYYDLGLGLGGSPMPIRGSDLAIGGLLEKFPNASAAYSLRGLRNNAGRVVNVRRSSDNADEDFTAYQLLDGSVEVFVGAGNDGFVTTWYDQSGNENHAEQTFEAYQPKIVENGSLLSELSFDGVDDYMDITSLTTLSNPFTMFQVVDLDNVNTTPNAFRPTIDGIDNSLYRVLTGNAEASSNDGFFAGSTVNASSLVADIALRTYFFKGDSSSEYFRNGTSVASGNVGSQTPDNGIRLGADHDLSGSSYSEIRFKEFIIYNSDQSSNRTAIETNINGHYSIF